MNETVMAWWKGRSLREQRLLLVMLALLGVTILWLGIYRPVDAALSAARARHADAAVRLGEVRAQATTLGALAKSFVAPPAGPLVELVTADANAAGFGAAVIAPQGDRRVSVSIPSARPAALFGWVSRLEGRGIIVERLSARANSDPTLAIDMTLVSGG